MRAIVFLLIIATITQGQTRLDVPGVYPTISAALAAAADTDVIYVAAGTYSENVVLHDDVHLIGAGAGLTVLDGGAGPALTAWTSRTAVVQGFTITGQGNGAVAYRSVSLVDCELLGTPGSGRGLWLPYEQAEEVDVTRCVIKGWGIAVERNEPSAVLRMIGCTIEDNGTGVFGGYPGGASLTDCLIVGNGGWGFEGGGLRNCTVYGNENGASGVFLTVFDSVIWGNTNAQLSAFSANVTYSTVQGGFAGTGNLALDPLFVDPTNGDFALQPTSPCVDAGHPAHRDPDGSRADMGWRPDLPLLPGAAVGNEGVSSCIGVPFPPPTLMVNAAGGGYGDLTRRVDVATGVPITVTYMPIPGVPTPQAFVLVATLGIPSAGEQTFLPNIGLLAFAPPGFGNPNAFILASTYALPEPAVYPGVSAPWTTTVPSGVPIPATITLQTIAVFDGAAMPTCSGVHLRTSNAVLLNVY